MILNQELQAVQQGKKGETLRKILNTLIMYGEAQDAEEMIPVTGEMGHSVVASGTYTWNPVFEIYDEMIESGLVSKQKFTTDPKAYDRNVPANMAQKFWFKIIFSQQRRLERELDALGLVNDKAYSCTSYLDEVGNIPKRGDILSWAESSAVVYANSVLGARCNRNSGMIEMMGSVLGYVPKFGFLTDEGRRADWIVEVRCKNRPDAQLLGSAVGMKVVDKVPFIRGLDKWIGTELTPECQTYLKDFGAATASNGAVGLYHIENLTPEAKDMGESLINEGARIYVIDDDEIKRVQDSYPVIWKDPDAKPDLCFVGCPHMTLEQLLTWTHQVSYELVKAGRKRVCIPTAFTAAPDVVSEFKKYPEYRTLKKCGVALSSICPLSYMSGPASEKRNVITCSNKLRTYTNARFYNEQEILTMITKGVR